MAHQYKHDFQATKKEELKTWIDYRDQFVLDCHQLKPLSKQSDFYAFLIGQPKKEEMNVSHYLENDALINVSGEEAHNLLDLVKNLKNAQRKELAKNNLTLKYKL